MKKFNAYATLGLLFLIPSYLNNSPEDYQNYRKSEAIYQHSRQKFLGAVDRFIEEQKIREKLANSPRTMGMKYRMKRPDGD